MTYRGSRKHVLDWTSQPGFLNELQQLVAPIDCQFSGASVWAPRGYAAPKEARLESFGPLAMPIRETIRDWWLVHHRGANTPNWDIAATCQIEGRDGLVLVEAKANVPELSVAGKPPADPESPASGENHERIGAAIAEACNALRRHAPSVALSHQSYCQLSNRLAFAWKLASLGLPIVLLYLGFIGDNGISDAGLPFSSAEHWTRTFDAEYERAFPPALQGAALDCGSAPMWLLVRSRTVLEQSPKRVPRKRRTAVPQSPTV